MIDPETAKQTALEVWEDDLLGRYQDAEIIRVFTKGHLDLLEAAGETRTYVLNLDASWGSGKSFFLSRLQKHLAAHGHVAVYINAWEDDHSEDPFLTVVDCIERELRLHAENTSAAGKIAETAKPLGKTIARILGGAALSGGKHLARRYIGNEALEQVKSLFEKDGEELSEEERSDLNNAIMKSIDKASNLAGEEVLNEFRKQKEIRTSFKQQLHELGKLVFESDDIPSPIYVLIDELDRCRPNYAIELLERVKHIFSIDDFVFILGTDTSQLSKAIKGVYGAEFDGETYLKRFIDRTYRFQPTELSRLTAAALNRAGMGTGVLCNTDGYSPNDIISETFSQLNIEPRSAKRIIDIMGTFAAYWEYNDIQINTLTLLPLAIQKHFDLTRHDLTLEINKVKFFFKTHRTPHNQEGRKPISLDNMFKFYDQISGQDANRPNTANSYEVWAMKKVANDSRKLSDLDVSLTTSSAYEARLDRVATISSNPDEAT